MTTRRNMWSCALLACGLAITSFASEPIPRALGPKFSLDMDEISFGKEHHVTPSRCASCYEGEHMTMVVVDDVTSVLPQLGAFGLSSNVGRLPVTCFFLNGTLQSMRVADLKAPDGFRVVKGKYGKGKVVEKRHDLQAIEWVDSLTVLRITNWQGDYEVILARRTDKKKPHAK